MFTSDFKYVADYFVQMRKNRDYIPSKETMKHVDAVLKIMSVLTNDNRFMEAWDEMQGGLKSMCEVLDRTEKKGAERERFSAIERMLKDGKTPEQISGFCGYAIEEVLAVQKEISQTV